MTVEWKLLKRKCDQDGNLHGIYDNGLGEQKTVLEESTSARCLGVTGRPYYESFPPNGTMLSVRCTDDYKLLAQVADGHGNSNERVVEVNSAQCGYQEKNVAKLNVSSVVSLSELQEVLGTPTTVNNVPEQKDTSKLLPLL